MALIPDPTYCKSDAVRPNIKKLPLVTVTAEAAMRKPPLRGPFCNGGKLYYKNGRPHCEA